MPSENHEEKSENFRYRIFLVEDDPVIAGLLKDHLERWGYEVSLATEFNDVLHAFTRSDPHLVLMDISLPFYNGYHWCGEIRRVSKTPVVFISSASDNMNIVMALQTGGDDFIAKPFDLDVVAAKVIALLRRTYEYGHQSNLLSYRGAVLNLADASLSWQDRKTLLTRNEFRILQVLIENKGAVVSRNELMKRLWDDDCYVDDNTLTVNVTRLRKTLDEIGLHHVIQTRKGVGYGLAE